MTTQHDIDGVARTVRDRVAHGSTVRPRRPVRAETARALTIEFDAEPYPEVDAAFAEFCKITGTRARLAAYRVRPMEDETDARARVTVTLEVDRATSVGEAVADDVVAGSVRAFAAAASRAA